MKSVDKLRTLPRHGTNGFGSVVTVGEETIEAIVNEIEREIAEAEAFCRRVEEAARNSDELDVFGVAYMPPPVDADGVPVRIGDMMEFSYDPPQDQPIFKVSGFGAKGALFYVPRGEIRARKTTMASVVRHVKPDTLKGLLDDVSKGIICYPRERVTAYLEDNHSIGEAVMLDVRDRLRELMGGDAE